MSEFAYFSGATKRGPVRRHVVPDVTAGWAASSTERNRVFSS
jgi:hypothetical protein